MLEGSMRDVLELRPLEVFPRVVGVLDHVVGGVGLDQPDDPLDAVEWRGGAAGLEDDPTTDILTHLSGNSALPSLRHKQRTLGQNVGVNLSVAHEGDDFTLGNQQHLLQGRSGQLN